jgi:hypothetical protein
MVLNGSHLFQQVLLSGKYLMSDFGGLRSKHFYVYNLFLGHLQFRLQLYNMLPLLAYLCLASLRRLAHLLNVRPELLNFMQVGCSGFLKAPAHLVLDIHFGSSHLSFQFTDQEVLSFQLGHQSPN